MTNPQHPAHQRHDEYGVPHPTHSATLVTPDPSGFVIINRSSMAIELQSTVHITSPIVKPPSNIKGERNGIGLTSSYLIRKSKYTEY